MTKKQQEKNMSESGKKHIFIFAALAVIICAIFTGCDAGSNGPIMTEAAGGSGYRIQMASSLDSIAVDGSTTITAVIFEPDGSPIRDNEDVLFASSEGGSFTDSVVKTANGQASVNYTAGNTPMKYDTITASCRGAIANIPVWILPANF